MQPTQPRHAIQRLQNPHAIHATLPATASDIAVTILPATAALPAVAIDPATPALATVATDPATALLATVAAEPTTAELDTVATDPATAVEVVAASGAPQSGSALRFLATTPSCVSANRLSRNEVTGSGRLLRPVGYGAAHTPIALCEGPTFRTTQRRGEAHPAKGWAPTFVRVLREGAELGLPGV